MNVFQEYKKRLTDPDEVAAEICDYQTIVVAMAASEPPGLLQALAKRVKRLEGVRLCSCLLLRDYGFMEKELEGHILNESWFYGPYERRAHGLKTVTHLPNNLHEAGQKKVKKDQVDWFFGTATPMDENGYLSLSLGITYEKTMIKSVPRVVLEINENLPVTHGDTQIHIRDIHQIVEHREELVELPLIQPSKEEEMIGSLVADFVEDGSTIQLGIGGIPNAIAKHLLEKHDLGIHTEMFTDGMVDLFRHGVITGKKKTLWPEKMVGTFALGTKKLYQFLHQNPGLEFQQGHITNDPYIIGKNHKMVSINTALQVDLTGQVVSEWLKGRQFSGTGGQVDTHRGAQRSTGGKGIIALRSTVKNNLASTIVPVLPLGAPVTLGRQEVDMVVTEYGWAALKGMSVRERVKRLIQIAHPDFRRDLFQEAKRQQLI